MEIKTCGTLSTVLHQIDLDLSGQVPLPTACMSGYPLVDERVSPGGRLSLQVEYLSLMSKASVNGARTDPGEFFCHLTGDEKLLQLPKSIYLSFEERSKPLTTGVVEDLPYFHQCPSHVMIVGECAASSSPGPRGDKGVQFPNNVLSVLPGIGAVLIKDAGFVFTGACHKVPLLHNLQVLLPRAHIHCLPLPGVLIACARDSIVFFGYFSFGTTIYHSVTFWTVQCG